METFFGRKGHLKGTLSLLQKGDTLKILQH